MTEWHGVNSSPFNSLKICAPPQRSVICYLTLSHLAVQLGSTLGLRPGLPALLQVNRHGACLCTASGWKKKNWHVFTHIFLGTNLDFNWIQFLDALFSRGSILWFHLLPICQILQPLRSQGPTWAAASRVTGGCDLRSWMRYYWIDSDGDPSHEKTNIW